jgi:xanthine dehydrogenase accessory factor
MALLHRRQDFIAMAFAFQRVCAPRPKLVVAGGDPVALALVALGLQAGWDIVLHRPRGPLPPPARWQTVHYSIVDADAFFADEDVDIWTAIVCINHDLESDVAVLVHALRRPAFYVGVLR